MFRTVMASAVAAVMASVGIGAAAQDCPDLQRQTLAPADPALCAELAPVVRKPSGLPLNEYEAKLGEFFGAFCHRDSASGWVRDKHVRDTGPYINALVEGKWEGTYYGTHAPVMIWYSPDFHQWLEKNRPVDENQRPAEPEPVPAGAMIVKEMLTPPAARCASADPMKLLPSSGAAFMVSDPDASHDGWYWGWFGWSGWAPDWPPGPDNRPPNQGFGQYCTNCHASATDNLTFASLSNIENEPGEPLVFLSQNFRLDATPPTSHHREVTLPTGPAPRLGQPLFAYNPAFLETFGKTVPDKPGYGSVTEFPSATYDNVWVKKGKGDGAGLDSQYVTSDQCAGCHDAGGTGLQFDMTKPLPPDNPHGYELMNLSPYATWRTSPMGLAGRDPIFFAQLASETQTFHPGKKAFVENTCLGCHGILGQRQYELDNVLAGQECGDFSREMVAAVPYPPGNPSEKHADYGALARDGISCAACHHAVFDPDTVAKVKDQPQNVCVVERQKQLNDPAGLTGFASTFTGSFFVGPPDAFYGPFEDPKQKPMQHALGITPEHKADFASSELCGSCHTVHLPVVHNGETLKYTYEQTTYPEWLFSDYRTGTSPMGPLPLGPGKTPQSCEACHMESTDKHGEPFVSKIASIQEHSNFPQVENGLGPAEIDLSERERFARHTLAGLNVFLIKMAEQFPDIFGIATIDPMLVGKGLPPLMRTEQRMLDQADNEVATIAVSSVSMEYDALTAKVSIENKVGHKFPSGVGFRRAFVEFQVLDQLGRTIWSSGSTNGAGVIVDKEGQPIDGELWWKDDCSDLVSPGNPQFQPHFQTITSSRQAQIYQELVTAPADVPNPSCIKGSVTPGGNLTTSFLSICENAKDNRLLPHGFLSLDQRVELSKFLGANAELAEESGPHHVGDDPHYKTGGGDAFEYRIPLSAIHGQPTSVQATLHYQSIPPFYLQDRFCTAEGSDRDRLYFLAGHLNLNGTEAQNWRFQIVQTDTIPVGR